MGKAPSSAARWTLLPRLALALALSLGLFACGESGSGRCAVSDDECGLASPGVGARVDGGAAARRADGGPFVPATPTNPLQLPTVMAGGLHSPFTIAIDDTSVFISNTYEGTIVRVPRGGGPAVEIAREAPYALGLALDGDRVYWASGYNLGVLSSVAKSGGPVSDLGDARMPGAVNHVIAFDATHIYWVHVGPDERLPTGSLFRRARNGITPEPIATALHAPTSLAVDDTHVYWLQANDFTNDDEGSLHSMPKGGGTIRDLGSAGIRPFELLLRGDYLYWVAEGTSFGNGTLRRVAKSGGHTFTLASQPQLYFYAFVDGWLYFNGQEARILRVPSDGSTAPIAVANSETLITAAFAGDARDLYFTVAPTSTSPATFDGKLVRIEP